MTPLDQTGTYVERPWAFQVALSLLGPLFFLSYILTLLSPLPILYLLAGSEEPKNNHLWTAGAVVIGLGLCFLVKGLPGTIGFFLLAALPALVLGFAFRRKFSVERATVIAFFAVLLSFSAAAAIPLSNRETRMAAKQWTETQVKAFNDQLVAKSPEIAEDPAKLPLQANELPGLAITAILMLCTIPSLAIIRWNPQGFLRRSGIHRDFLRKWKAPEWLVWPTLLCALLLILDLPQASIIASNALKPLLLIYFFQGMSILAYFLDSLRFRGPLRVLVYASGALFLTPMVVSFGFFDLWLNFRGRRKPPVEDKQL